MPGKARGAYQLIEKIGEGAMGEVYRALHTELGREVALKCLRGEQALSAHALARFRREAQALKRVSHPSLVKVLDVCEEGGAPFLAMELVTGRTLDAAVAADPLGTRREADRIFLAAADAVAALHGAGLAHRDLKPANIMLTPEGRVVVMDLGVVKDFQGNWTQLTEAGAVVGTPAYLAPEVLANADSGTAADVWALGAIFFFLHAGRDLFRADSMPALLAAILRDPLPDLAHACPDLDPARRAFLAALLERDAGRRPRDARAAVELFQRATGGRTPSPGTDPDATPRRGVAREPARRPARTAGMVLGAVAALVAVLLSSAAVSRRPGPAHPAASASPAPSDASPRADVDAIEVDGILRGIDTIRIRLQDTSQAAPQHEDAARTDFTPRNRAALRSLAWIARELAPFVKRAYLVTGPHAERATAIEAPLSSLVLFSADQMEFAFVSPSPEVGALKEALRELRIAVDGIPRSLEMRAVRACALRNLDELIATGMFSHEARRAGVRGACKLLRDDAARRGWSKARLGFLIHLLGGLLFLPADPSDAGLRRELVELVPLHLSPGMRSAFADLTLFRSSAALAADRAVETAIRRRAVEAAHAVAALLEPPVVSSAGARAIVSEGLKQVTGAARELGIPDRDGALARIEALVTPGASSPSRSR